jgi:hypothetical protein
MSISTAPRDLAALKHAFELGLILAALINCNHHDRDGGSW